MSKMSLRLGAAVVLLTLVVGFGFGFFADTAYALPSNEVDRLYYSDGTYTNLVGERLLLCNGHLYSWGVVTSYRQTYYFPCW